MVKKLAAMALGLILGTAGYYWYADEEKHIKKRFAVLEENLTKKPAEPSLATVKKINTIKGLFANPSHIRLQRHPIAGNFAPRDIAQKAAAGRQQFSELNLKFYDLNLTLNPKDTVQFSVTVRLTGRRTNGEMMADVLELAGKLRKTDGEWFFAEIAEVEVLQQ